MFDLGDQVNVKTTGQRGTVIEFLRPGDRHPVRGVRVDHDYSYVLFAGVGAWFNDDVLEGAA